jgi:hypothetical protein
MMNNKYTLEVQKDEESGELFFEFPDALMNQMGWDVGDTLIWEELPNSSWSLSLKKKEKDENTNNGTSGIGEDAPS